MSRSSSEDEPLLQPGEGDEEIDEDLAFTNEDRKGRFASWFQNEDGTDRDEAVSDSDAEVDVMLTSDVMDEDDDLGGETEIVDRWLDENDSASEESLEQDARADGDQPDAMPSLARKGTRRALRVLPATEAVVEHERNVGMTRGAGEQTALSVADLLAASGLPKADRKRLQSGGGRHGSGALSAALPRRIQERQARRAAYEAAQQAAGRWIPLVAANREARTLHLTSDLAPPAVATAAGIAARHEAMSEFEIEVAALLQKAGHGDARTLSKKEDELARDSMTGEELQARRNAMAKNNALLFYAEQKARRVKRIKSKAYHRRLKKASEKVKAALGLAGVEGEATALQEAQEEEELQRARERLTLKHRNTSRWARRALKRGLDLATDSQRAAIADQLRTGHELKARGKHDPPDSGSGDDAEGNTDASDDETEGSDADGNLTSKEKLELVQAVEAGADADNDALPQRGLLAMPFMRRALKVAAKATAAEARLLLSAQDSVAGLPDGEAMEGTDSGRRSFMGPMAALALTETAHTISDTDAEGGDNEDSEAVRGRLECAQEAEAIHHVDVVRGVETGPSGQRLSAERATARVAGQAASAGVAGDGRPEAAIRVHSGPQGKCSIRSAKGSGEIPSVQQPCNVQPEFSSVRESEETVATGQGDGSKVLHRDLISDGGRAALMEAFAGDDVVEEFKHDKEAVALESTVAIEEPSALPGWGAWASSKREPRWLREKMEKATAQRRQRLAARADAKLPGVIITEKWDRKAKRHTVSSIPYPYTSKEVYEKTMRIPLGRDVNTEASFRELTRPEVIKQTGQIIQPLKLNKPALAAGAKKRSRKDGIMVVSSGQVTKRKKH